MKYQLENTNSENRSVTTALGTIETGRTAEMRLSDWLDGQLEELEEKHGSFVTRDSLARHFSAKSDRQRSA